jgi:hypothetical protein
MSPPPERPWRQDGNGRLLIRVRVTTRAGSDAVGAIERTADGPALKVKVRALPADGAANAAVARAVADWLGVPKSRVEITAGGKSRVKMLCVAGDAATLATRLTALVAGLEGQAGSHTARPIAKGGRAWPG